MEDKLDFFMSQHLSEKLWYSNRFGLQEENID